MDELIITNRPLKEFFKFFGKEEELEIIALGDIWHPASGFVDETHFSNINLVCDLLNTDYDFEGLVHFSAKIKGLLIEYNRDYYKITGDKKAIEKLKWIVANWEYAHPNS